jgi:hypothetical protein
MAGTRETPPSTPAPLVHGEDGRRSWSYRGWSDTLAELWARRHALLGGARTVFDGARP